jgi:DNA invertase Pin-like site-specific DNA recombinase
MTAPRMDGYVRVSSVAGRSGERFQSPSQQRDAITAWAKANGVRIAKWHEDLDRSGGTMNRPGMNDALARIDAGKTDGIVCARLDRFARTLIGGLTTIKQITEKGARVVSVAESIDPSTPMGRAMLGLLLLMAEYFRDQADVSLGLAQERAASAGRFPGKPAYGYRKDENGHTLIDPDAAEVVLRIFRARAAGDGWRKVCDDLNREGIKTPLGRDYWQTSTLSGIVGSESYLGTFTGPRGLKVEEAWAPVVPKALWDAANARVGVRDTERQYHDRLFAGLVRCASCRYVMVRQVNPQGFVSYGCHTRGCRSKASMGAHLLDQYLSAFVDDRLQRGRLAASVTADNDAELQRLRAAALKAGGEFDRWRDDLEMRDVIGDDDYRAGLRARAKARDDAEADLAEFRARTGLGVIPDLPSDRTVALDGLPWEVRRLVVETLVHSVWVRKSALRGPTARRRVGERLRLFWRDDRALPVLPSKHVSHPGPFEW